MISIEKSETNKKKEHWKSETNLSRTMKFVPDFCHRLSIGHGLRQICLGPGILSQISIAQIDLKGFKICLTP